MTQSTDTKIEQYYSLNPKTFSVLGSINISQDVSSDSTTSPRLNLEFELRPQENEDTRKLVLKFQGVRDLRLHQPSWSIFNIPYLEIVSIKDKQWEIANYFVKEPEEETVSFACQDFESFIST